MKSTKGTCFASLGVRSVYFFPYILKISVPDSIYIKDSTTTVRNIADLNHLLMYVQESNVASGSLSVSLHALGLEALLPDYPLSIGVRLGLGQESWSF